MHPLPSPPTHRFHQRRIAWLAGLASAALLATVATHAAAPPNNLWPNATFEDGVDLDQPTGTPTGWNRGGNDGAVCQVSTIKSVSASHALAVVDDSAGYGEWYSDLPLPGAIVPGDFLDLEWSELFDIGANHEMRVTILIFDGGGAVAREQHYVVRGQSAGWAGTLAASPFVQRSERLTVPAGAAKLRVSLVSGGSAEGTGTVLIDDFSVVHVPKPKLLAGNIWPNGAFEEGENLDQATGNLTGWNRGGNEAAICQVSSLFVSPSHGLAVVDTSNGYGEWYADLDLTGKAAAGDQLDLQWFELFDIGANHEMRVTIIFINAANEGTTGLFHFVVNGQSAGWAGTLAASPFVKRNERLVVPDGTTKLRVAVVSGGPAEGQGTLVIDDLSVAPVPRPVEGLLTGNVWPNPTFEEGENLDAPEGTPAPWQRGGSDATICQVSSANSVTRTHSIMLNDENVDGYGEWYADYPLSGLIREGRLLTVQWFELHNIQGGEMRLTAVFLDGLGNAFGDHHWVARGDSSGWAGEVALSTFTKRTESLALPPGIRTLRLSLVSGGSLFTTGSMLVDNLSVALAPTEPSLLLGNFWPNAGFEQGDALDNPTQGKPLNWNRGGSDAGICQVTTENYNSSTHALALVDGGNGYGEWYGDLILGDKAKPGDSLGVQWLELFNVSDGGEMRLTALFFNAGDGVVGERHWVAKGRSSGWAGDVPNSAFTKRLETLVVPSGATKLRLALVSGGPGETTGVMIIDDLSVAPPPRLPVVLEGSFWPNPGFEEGAQLDSPKSGQPAAWSRGGSDATLDEISSVNWKSTAHSLSVADTRDDAYGEWYRFQDLSGIVQGPATLQAQWWWAYDTTGDMRLSFIFYGADNATLGQTHFVVQGQSPDWTGNLATTPLERRFGRIAVPEGATRMLSTLASGGSQQVTGTILLDDLSVRVAPPNADTDGDGMSDSDEAIAGTNPDDAASVLHLTAITPAADGVHLSWASVQGLSYTVEFTENLSAPFTPLAGAENIPASDTETTTSFTDDRGNRPAMGYYRVRVL